ncbi:MAG: hypothetical protein AAFY60_06930, partial [Myxococcota bacterium]
MALSAIENQQQPEKKSSTHVRFRLYFSSLLESLTIDCTQVSSSGSCAIACFQAIKGGDLGQTSSTGALASRFGVCGVGPLAYGSVH